MLSKRKTKNRLSWVLTIIIFLLVWLNTQADHTGYYFLSGKYTLPIFFFCVFIYAIAAVVRNTQKSNAVWREITNLPDVNEKIKRMEAQYEEGHFSGSYSLYLNQLSTLYYELDDYEEALTLTCQACQLSTNTKYIRIPGQMTLPEVCRINQATYLIMLERWEEAEVLLAAFSERKYKHSGAIYALLTAHIKIALHKGDLAAAKGYLQKIKSLSIKGSVQELDNLSWYKLLLEASCDLLEGEESTARTKLDEIINRCTYPPTVRQAIRLKG